jgi:cell division protein FtsB
MTPFAELCNNVISAQRKRIHELEAENQKLREQRDAANAQIQMLNSIIAGDVE